MIKKFFPVFLVFLLGVIILAPNFKSKQITKPEDVLKPTNVLQKSVLESEKVFLQISEPKDNVTVANQAITIKGKAISNGFVFVNDQEFRAGLNGNFSTTVILDEGENYILVVVSDEYGNSLEKDIVVNLESTQ